MVKKNKIEIRKAQIADVDGLYSLNKEFNGVHVNKNRIIDSIERDREIIIVAIKDDELIGFGCAQFCETMCYNENIGEITELYVREDKRNQGVGVRIIEKIEKELEKKGVNEIKVITNEKNIKAQGVYIKCKYIKQNWVVFTKKI